MKGEHGEEGDGEEEAPGGGGQDPALSCDDEEVHEGGEKGRMGDEVEGAARKERGGEGQEGCDDGHEVSIEERGNGGKPYECKANPHAHNVLNMSHS